MYSTSARNTGEKIFIYRFSNHIQEDISRNWSSWNFGAEGFEGTEEELIAEIESAIENESSFYVSGFDIWAESMRVDGDDIIINPGAGETVLRELYSGYWVAVDTQNFGDVGISVTEGPNGEFETMQEALEFARTKGFDGGPEASVCTDDIVAVHETDIIQHGVRCWILEL